MESKLTLPALTVLFVWLVMTAQPARAQSYAQTRATSEHDALLKLLAAHGHLTRYKALDNGFEVRYQIAGKAKTASSHRDKLKGMRSRSIQLDQGLAEMIMATKEQALEITTNLIFDVEKRKLIIERRLRNISGCTVRVLMMGQYVDPKLLVGDPNYADNQRLVRAALDQIRAGQLIQATSGHATSTRKELIAGYRKDCECVPPPPPCEIKCPPTPNYLPAQLNSGARKIALQWKEPIILTPHATSSGDQPLTSEVSFVIELNIPVIGGSDVARQGLRK